MPDLPIFPLNTVLFPGVPLDLHIFEPRYLEMINFCLEAEAPFGVVLIRDGREALGPLAEIFDVGCSAKILKTEPLGDGRMNIATIGIERFRIAELDRSRPYLMGSVETFTLVQEEKLEAQKRANLLRKWVVDYLTIIEKELPEPIEGEFLPIKPVALAYIASYLLQTPQSDKQNLIESPTVEEFLDRLINLYRREIALSREIYKGNKPTELGFNLN